MRVCPFPGCPKVIQDEMFACGKHWYSLDAGQQARIWAAYKQYMRGQLALEELRRVQQEVLDEVQARTSA